MPSKKIVKLKKIPEKIPNSLIIKLERVDPKTPK